MDNAHAHPPSRPPPPATLPSRLRTNRDQNAEPDSASPSARQQRLLRTRNAKFHAKKLSISSLSSRFSQLIKPNEHAPPAAPPAPRNQENTVYRPHKDCGQLSHSTSSLGILEEISNSIGVRSKAQQKRPPIPVYLDTPERGLLQESPYTSPSPQNQSSLVNSPAPFGHIQDSLSGMGLREISGNARKVSAVESPPFFASIRTGRRRKSSSKSRFNSEEYIEHIERELELVKDAVYSPNSNRPWKEKLKIAKAENERLRKEILDIRSAFEIDVQRTVEHLSQNEVDLRKRVRSLEDELETKESAIHNLESQHDEKRLDQSTVETMKATIEKLEMEKVGLEQDNQSMSRRNEVLTQLLALSPTKSQHFDLTSPIRRSHRPKSMMIPRIPSSPSHNVASRPQSVVASPSASASCYFSPTQPSLSTPPQGRLQDFHSEYAAPRSLARSLTGSSSRRSTLASDASVSPSLTSQQQSISEHPEIQQKQQNPKRRTRRFQAGSTQLKPFLLPTLTGENGVLHSTSTTSPEQVQRREFSEESIDPTTTFMSKSPIQYESELHSYPFGHGSDTLTEASRQLAYQSLEGVLDDQHLNDGNVADVVLPWDLQPHALPIGNIDVSVEEAWAGSQETLNQWMRTPSPDGGDDFDVTILPTQLERHIDDDDVDNLGEATNLEQQSSPSPAMRHTSVEVPQPLFSPFSRQRTSQYFTTPKAKRRITPLRRSTADLQTADPRNSRKRRKLSTSSQELTVQEDNATMLPATTEVSRPSAIEVATPTHSRKSSSSCLSLHSPGRTKSPLEILQQCNINAAPLAAVTIKTIYGTLSRYTTYIREIKRDPLALARRVIANAWHLNWAILGKLSWWVLGLFLGPSRLNQDGNAWDWRDYDTESIADQHCLRRSRALDEDHLPHLPPSQSPERHVRFDEQHRFYRTRGSRSPARPALKTKSGWGESLMLWGKFSVAIIMAVGGAMVKGPGEMMREADERSAPQGPKGQRRDVQDQSPSRIPFNETTFERPEPQTSLPDSATSPRRLCNRSPSPPPSARMLLRSSQISSSPKVTSSPAFQFRNNEVFNFSSPCRDHDWRDFEIADDTLKPGRTERTSLDDLFSSPLTGPATFTASSGGKEYDPESVGLVFFDPLRDVTLPCDDGGSVESGRSAAGLVFENG